MNAPLSQEYRIYHEMRNLEVTLQLYVIRSAYLSSKRRRGYSMVQFLVKRLIGLVFVVICVTFITFIMGYFAPGDPIRTLLGQHYTLQAYLQLKHAYGLDLPWYQQYLNYLNGLLHGNLGLSIVQQNRSVWDMLKSGVPVSTELALWALVIQVIVGIPLGILAALKANTWIDTAIMGIMLVFYAIPPF